MSSGVVAGIVLAKNSTWVMLCPLLGVAVVLMTRLLPVFTPALLAGAVSATVGEAVTVMLLAALVVLRFRLLVALAVRL